MQRARFIRRTSMVFMVFFVIVLNTLFAEAENKYIRGLVLELMTPDLNNPIETAHIRVYDFSNFDDLEFSLGIPYYQIISKIVKISDVKDIKSITFYYKDQLGISIADIKIVYIFDKSRVINEGSLSQMRNEFLTELIRYEKFREYKFVAKPSNPKTEDFLINKTKVFVISNAYWYHPFGYSTGYNVAFWREDTKLIFCTATFGLDNFLKRYAGDISNFLRKQKSKIEQFKSEPNESQRRSWDEWLGSIKDFLNELK